MEGMGAPLWSRGRRVQVTQDDPVGHRNGPKTGSRAWGPWSNV